MSARPSSPAAPQAPREISIDRLAAGGDGVGRLDGKVVFVPLTAPGDVVEAAIVQERRAWCRARLRRVVHPGPERVEPPCPRFGACGGCSWQHVSYPGQLAAKGAIVEDALRRLGRLAPPPVPPPLPSPRAYGYRHRARLHAARGANGTVFGFFRAGSREVVPLEACPILHPGLEQLLPALAAAALRHAAFFGRCGEARLDADYEGAAVRVALATPAGLPLAVPPEVAAALRAGAGDGVRLLIGEGAGAPLRLGPGDGALVTTGATFTQVNLGQNVELVRAALGLAGVRPGDAVLDLFCGLGNLSLPAAVRGATVLGVDLDAEAIRQAEENAARLGLPGARFRAGDAAAAARALADAGRRFDLVTMNPPRGGAAEAAAAAAALGPERVLVVSCDPATLARDAAVLARAGYGLAALVPLDLFPQTAHVETVALFTRGAT